MNTAQIRRTMQALAESCRDPGTGEMNCTRLAEGAAQELDLYEGADCAIPEEVFDLALEFDEPADAARWCDPCGARTSAQCRCGPLAKND